MTNERRPSTIDHRPSTIDHRPSTIDHRPSTIDHAWLFAALITGVAACTTPNPIYRPRPDAGADASETIDPKEIVRVSPSGSDSADGVAAPVKTIKRAIEIAASDGAIKMISLEAGKYNAANGEKYPYTLPSGVKLTGAPGTTLGGTGIEDGLVIDTGTVENLEFSDFNTALRATSTVTLNGVTVKTSKVGVLADGSANVQATTLTIVGDAECKTIGVKAIGMSQVAIDSFVATDALALDGRDQAAIAITHGAISAKPSICRPQMKMFGKSLTISDATITGGKGGLWLNHDMDVPFKKNEQLDVKLTNTTIADVEEIAMISEADELQMTGGEIRNNQVHGVVLLGGGMQTFASVGVIRNRTSGIVSDQADVRVKLRSCTISGNDHGVVVTNGRSIDLGTAADPGNNTILNNRYYGLNLNSGSVVTASAVGNTWAPNSDGSDGSGRYEMQAIVGFHDGGNFYIQNAASRIQL